MFSGFEILGKLGEGGMGTVYKARDPKLDRFVALKVLNPHVASEQTYARFQREMKILARLHHRSIVRLFTVGQHRNRVYFTMEYIEGENLAALIHKAATWDDRKTLVRHLAMVARAVHYAHAQGVIHRDLKPSNVIISKEGAPFITDFGLAKELEGGTTVTLSGAAIGTAAYMSPEQAEGDQEKIGPASDTYSLGAVLYEILVGRAPFEGPTTAAILKRVVNEEPVSPRKLDRNISRGLEAVCLKCLQKGAKERYESAEALAVELERYLAGQHTRAAARRAVRLALVLPFSKRWYMVAARVLLLVLAAFLFARTSYFQKEIRGRARVLVAEWRGEDLEEAPIPAAVGGAVNLAGPRTDNRADAAAAALPLEHAAARIASYYAANNATAIAASDDEVWWGSDSGATRLTVADGATWFVPTPKPVRAIVRDNEGTWRLATWGSGVAHYEGQEFSADSLQPRGNNVWGIAVDPVGGLWFGTENGITAVHAGARVDYIMNGGKAFAFEPDGHAFWYGLSSAVCRFDLQTQDGVARCVGHEILTNEFLRRYGPVTAVAIDRAGLKWFGTRGGLCCLDGNTWRFYSKADGLPDDRVLAVVSDPDGRLWIGTMSGVSCFDGKQWTCYTKKDGLAGDVVNAIAVAPGGAKWFATDRGVCRLDGSGWRTYSPNQLLSNTIAALAVDSAGRKWFGFGDRSEGVTSFDGKVWRVFTAEDGVPRGDVRAIAVDQDGRKWFSAKEPPLFSFDDQKWTSYPFVLQEEGDWVQCIGVDSSGVKWVGTRAGLVLRFDGQTWRSHRVPDASRRDNVMAFGVDHRGVKWFGTGLGACALDEAASVPWRVYTRAEGLGGDFIQAVAVDRDGVMWFATRGQGVSRFDGSTWTSSSTKHGLADDRVRAIVVDSVGRKWFGTNKGVSCFDGKTWRTWTTKDFLAGDDVTALAVDLDGSIWVGTTAGVSHLVLEKAE